MQSAYDDLAKQRMQQSKALCSEAGRGGLNLGKKISIPKDVMMEELNLQSNRGSLFRTPPPPFIKDTV
ncbi:Myozenin-1 [Salmo salar]|uniref:Myozenin-1 n=1 Tax=Salmo salar TaxID=8030 RepID=B9EP61_SALSA|nr:Myozenin-1 [Salmo salar]ACM09308.1 Myozenin-1 [Salmo salar]|eukprot:NP_001140029.1 Myozenin-1 [Salmo salar]